MQSATATVTSLTKMVPTASKNHDGNNNTGNNGGSNNGSSGNSNMPSMRTPLAQDSERAQFVLKLAPRIRRLEAELVIWGNAWSEKAWNGARQEQEGGDNTNKSNGTSGASAAASQEDLLLMLGHCMRGLALLGRGKEVESIFARVAIMPLIRSTLSMGRLDEGGSRGECAGLFSLLDDMSVSVQAAFGPVLCLAESMFDVGGVRMDVDLLTCGVWVGATALMAVEALNSHFAGGPVFCRQLHGFGCFLSKERLREWVTKSYRRRPTAATVPNFTFDRRY
jgi:hypothetical protein